MISPEVRTQIVQEVLAGEHVNDVAAKYNVGRSTVYVLLKERGITLHADRQAIVAQYATGASSSAVAAAHDVSHVTVLRAVREAGGVVRPRGPVGPHQVEPATPAARLALALVRAGRSMAEAAAIARISRQRVWDIMRRYGMRKP